MKNTKRCLQCKKTEGEVQFRSLYAVYCTTCVAGWDLSAKYQGEDDKEEDDD